jgi:hypothetical protein
MKLSRLLACLVLLPFCAVLMAAISEPNSPATTPQTWTVTSGPTPGNFPWPPSFQQAAGFGIQGRIEPPLAAGVTGGITSAKLTSCDGTGDVPLSADCFMGGAGGASFTAYINAGAGCAGTNCATVEVCYTLNNGGTECVRFHNPVKRAAAVVDFGANAQLPIGTPVLANLRVVGVSGELLTSYSGSVSIWPSALGAARVRIDGAFGVHSVRVVDGLASFTIEAVAGASGDTVILDLIGDGRIDPTRAGITVL